MYSNNLSFIATISSLIISELFPACFSCSNSFNLLQSSSGSDDKNIVFETPEAEILKPGDLSNFIRVRSRVDFYLQLLDQSSFLLQNRTLIFCPLN